MRKGGIEANVVTYGALIHACARVGDVARAEQWLEKMHSANVQANAVTYNAVMSACTKNGDLERAQYWLQAMTDAGITPDVVSYNTIITACAKAGDLEKAEEWLSRMEKVGIKPNLVPFLCMIQSHSCQGHVRDVERLFSQVLQRRLRPDARFVSAIILAHGNAKPRQPAQAIRAFQQLVSKGIPVDHVAVQALSWTVGRKMATQLCNDLNIDVGRLEHEKSLKPGSSKKM